MQHTTFCIVELPTIHAPDLKPTKTLYTDRETRCNPQPTYLKHGHEVRMSSSNMAYLNTCRYYFKYQTHCTF